MRTIVPGFTAAFIIGLGSVGFADSNDLFSDVRPGSVFGSSSSGNADAGTGTKPSKRLVSPEEVREMLNAAEFDAKVLSNRIVTMKKELAPWSFPVMVILAEDETTLTIVLGLSTIKDVEKDLPAKTLLRMMNASQNNAPSLFAYHATRERMELSLVVKNQGLTGQQLRDTINRMAILAKNTEDIWASKSETPSEPDQESNSTPQTTTASLAGKWSAVRSNTEAFAVEFSAGGTFNLVHIKNGQQTRSSGKFTVTQGSLSLLGDDGVKLAGKLTLTSDTQFSFQIQNTTPLVFSKAS
ncbi:MAG: hypothetical protein MK110_09930 [Fuerstiella sp.]|nr:hypothetical protein [Fuerstiella sp.]